MIIDEADIDLVGGGSPQRSLSRRSGAPDVALRMPLKRKPGPIPRHVTLKKRCISPISMPIPTPPMSPIPPVINGDIGKPREVQDATNERKVYRLSVPDEINVPVLKLEEEPRPRSPSPPPLDVLTPPSLEPFEHYNEDAPPPLSLISDFDESATSTVNHHDHTSLSNESDADSGVDEYIGANNIDDSVANPSNKCKQQVLSKKDLEEIKRYNLSIRASIYKEVRRFGKSKHDFRIYISAVCT